MRNITSPIKVVAVHRLNRRIATTSHTDPQIDTSASATYSPSLSISPLKDRKFLNSSTCSMLDTLCLHRLRESHAVITVLDLPISKPIVRVNHVVHTGTVGKKDTSSLRNSANECKSYQDARTGQGDHRANSPLYSKLAIQKEIRRSQERLPARCQRDLQR